jgi:hypothetical protein
MSEPPPGGSRPAFVRQLPAQTLWGLVGLKAAKEVLRRRGVLATTVTRKPDPELDAHDLMELDAALELARPDHTCPAPDEKSRKVTSELL